MVIDQSLFYDLTQLSSEGVPFEGTLDDDWKFDFSMHDAHRLVCTNQTDMIGRLLSDSLALESHILNYLIVRIFLLRSLNLAQVFEEDLIVMWAFHTGWQIDWAYLVRYRMHKALRLNTISTFSHSFPPTFQHPSWFWTIYSNQEIFLDRCCCGCVLWLPQRAWWLLGKKGCSTKWWWRTITGWRGLFSPLEYFGQVRWTSNLCWWEVWCFGTTSGHAIRCNGLKNHKGWRRCHHHSRLPWFTSTTTISLDIIIVIFCF